MATPQEQARKVADLLRQLQEAGADVSEGGKGGKKLTKDTLAKLSADPEMNWEAWVAWTKRF